MPRQLDVMPLANKPCESCGNETAWFFPSGDCLCASCFHEGEKPKQVKAEIRENIKKSRQHPESDFQKAVIGLLRTHKFKVAHFKRAKVPQKGGEWRWITPVAADGAGFPDIVAIRDDGKGIAWELKSSRAGIKAVPAEQRTWLDLFAAAGFHAHLYCPDDWDEIERTLR